MTAQRPFATAGTRVIPAATIPCHDARDLIPDGIKADIVLDGQIYTLRITRAGKLILTK